MTVSNETILELAEEARRSPYARRVLYDALAERFDPFFDARLRLIAGFAQQDGEPRVVLFDPFAFADAARQGSARQVIERAIWSTSPDVFRTQGRFRVSDLMRRTERVGEPRWRRDVVLGVISAHGERPRRRS